MKLDLGCGRSTREGYTGVDILPVGDLVVDLFAYPWPFEAGSVEALHLSHFVEHIPHWRPGWTQDGWWVFWDEVYRVCAPGATIEVVHPYSRSDRAFIDPTHTRYIHEHTWLHFDPTWAEENKVAHDAFVKFEVEETRFLTAHEERYQIVKDQPLAFSHWFNITDDLYVRMRRR